MADETPLQARLLSTVLWRRRDAVSLDYFRLQEFANGYILNGRVLTILEGMPAEVRYAVMCDRSWVTQHAHAGFLQGNLDRQLELMRRADGTWWRNGAALPELTGLADVDFSITPATNTLPIRRLALDVGDSAAVDAVWVRFPELSSERLAQRYTRTADLEYRYESGGGAFVADLQVDEAGAVVRYGEIWERVAP